MKHSNLYDHIRLLAAALVLYSHHFALWGLPEPQGLGTSLGGLGVGIFFVLSGFLVSNSLQADPHALRFLMRRALRILPGLTVNVLLTVLVLGAALTTLPLRAYFEHEQVPQYFLNLLFQPRFQLPAVFVDARVAYSVNGSLWTLPFEILAYLVLTALCLVPRLSMRVMAPLLLFISLVGMLAWHPAAPQDFWGNDLRKVPYFMALFFAGATVSAYRQALLKPDLVIAALFCWAFFDAPAVRAVLSVLTLALFFIYVGSRTVGPRWALKDDCSYGVYLYAYPVQQACIQLVPGWGFWPTMALSAAITYGLALLSWRLVERTALKFKPRRATATTAAPIRSAAAAPVR